MAFTPSKKMRFQTILLVLLGITVFYLIPQGETPSPEFHQDTILAE